MKSAAELKKLVFSRFSCCFGELCTLFCLSVGGLSALILAPIICVMQLDRAGLVDIDSGYISPEFILVMTAALLVFIIATVAITPLSYGIKWYRLQQVKGNSVYAKSIFSCYASAGKMWKVLRINSILILKKLYVILPFAAVSALSFYSAGIVDGITDGDTPYYIMFFCAILLTFVMLSAAAVINSRYAAVPFLYAMETELSPTELIAESKRIMKGKKKYLSEVMFSLSGWLVPCLMIFPMIFIIPYINMVYTAAMNEIITDSQLGEAVHEDGSRNVEAPVSV